MRPFVLCLLCAFISGPMSAVPADPTTEMAAFSVFGRMDLAELANSSIKTAVGAPMATPGYMSVQSCFVIPKTPAQVIDAMKQFDPTAHRELKVYLHADLPLAPGPNSFSKLGSANNEDAFKSLATATEKMASDLQISRAEAQKFSPGQPVGSFWIDILSKRAQDFIVGGAARQPPYDHTPESVQPGRELSGLVRQQEKVNRQFSGLLGSTGLGGGRGSLKPDLYWELLEVEDNGVLTLGASYTRPTSSGGFQVADGLYYASGGYYVALTLFQLWPIDLGGRTSTLVWRGDFISAASLGELHGVERLASEGAMKKDISKAVSVFQRDASR